MPSRIDEIVEGSVMGTEIKYTITNLTKEKVTRISLSYTPCCTPLDVIFRKENDSGLKNIQWEEGYSSVVVKLTPKCTFNPTRRWRFLHACLCRRGLDAGVLGAG